MYSNDSSSVPEPDEYSARPSERPVSKSSRGAPVTETGPENSTAISTPSPMPYAPSGAEESTPVTTAGRNPDITRTVPLSSSPSSSWPGAPTATSTAPSPFKSPNRETDEPNMSPADSPGAPPTWTACLAEPSAFINSTQPAPSSLETPGAPTATSGTPSRSKSPIPDTDEPNR